MVTNGSGVLSFAAVGASAGQVIQVVTATDSTQRTTLSTSFVTVSNTLSVTITPSSASNKIFIIVSTAGQNDRTAYFTIFRDATDIGAASNKGLQNVAGVADVSAISASAGMAILDSPNTTSATTYQVYFRTSNSGNTAYLNTESCKGTITCMEIKG